MKLFRIDWQDDEPTAQTTDWATSRRNANRIARETGSPDAHITEIDVPTDRVGLLKFLQKHIWCDAGKAIARAQRD